MEHQITNHTGMHLSASVLKTLAIIFMVIDHIGALLVSVCVIHNPGLQGLYDIMRSIGRLAFPLFAFLLVQGFTHSHSRRNYLLWLAVSALITEPFFNYAYCGKWHYADTQNVMFTLSLSLLMLIILEKINSSGFPKAARLLLASLTVALIVVIGYYDKCDFGMTGPLIVLGIKYIDDNLRYRPVQMYGAMLATIYISFFIKNCIVSPVSLLSLSGIHNLLSSSVSIQLYGALSVFFISAYDGTRGHQLPKAVYYAVYPAHLFLLGIIKYLLF